MDDYFFFQQKLWFLLEKLKIIFYKSCEVIVDCGYEHFSQMVEHQCSLALSAADLSNQQMLNDIVFQRQVSLAEVEQRKSQEKLQQQRSIDLMLTEVYWKYLCLYWTHPDTIAYHIRRQQQQQQVRETFDAVELQSMNPSLNVSVCSDLTESGVNTTASANGSAKEVEIVETINNNSINIIGNNQHENEVSKASQT